MILGLEMKEGNGGSREDATSTLEEHLELAEVEESAPNSLPSFHEGREIAEQPKSLELLCNKSH
jgi:hypothetical protein